MKKLFIFLSLFLFSTQSFAWGKRGHALICETAAHLASHKKPSLVFLKQNSFDLAYYCNVPDLIWKRPKTYKKEFTNHFMNLEVFEREIGKTDWLKKDSPIYLSRKDFDKKNPKIPRGKGRSWWRIRELDKKIAEVTKKLKKKNLKKKEQQNLQEQWLTLVGVAGHYVGDLAMPLHVSENYDGQLSGQEGLHHYFEETMVYELFLQKKSEIQHQAFKKALKQWPALLKRSKDKPLIEILKELSLNSQSRIPSLLKLDKKTGREDLNKSLKAYKPLVIERLSKGILYQAYFINRHLGWDFDSKKYYNFNEKPEFVGY